MKTEVVEEPPVPGFGAPITVSNHAGIITVSVPSVPAGSYQLEYKNALTDADWTPLPAQTAADTSLLLSDGSPTQSQRFYRVRRLR